MTVGERRRRRMTDFREEEESQPEAEVN